MNYTQHYQTKQTPQSQPIPGTSQVQNSAGGFVWAVDDWARLDRFLILGGEGGTYYISERKLTIDNAEAVRRCILVDGPRVVARIVEISHAGRAPKNDPALFALAMCAGLGNLPTRQAALAALPKVARIGTHLFHFAQYVEGFRGWGRGLRTAVQKWYNEKPVPALALQAVKYQQRDGWSHRDLLRLAKPKTTDVARNALYRWIAKGELGALGNDQSAVYGLELVAAFERARTSTTATEIIDLVSTHKLPWETLPTQWLADPAVWQALLPDLPMTALLRNLGRMTANGALKLGAMAPISQVVAQLTNPERIKQARIHPIAVLSALKTYQQGHGERGSLTWSPIGQIVDALDKAFYLSFGNVAPTGKRLVLALDVSGSMTSGNIAGVPGLTPRAASAAMALITAATEPNTTMVAFTNGIQPLDISPRQRLDDVIKRLDVMPFGGTDCALPMIWAGQRDVQADAFVIYTDNETWAGGIHPAQALRQYRHLMNNPTAKLIVVGMTSTGFTIADPDDAGMLDAVGFDSATPAVISQFVAG